MSLKKFYNKEYYKMLSIDNKIYIIISLITVYTIYGFFAFKMHNSLFNMTLPKLLSDFIQRKDGYTEHSNIEWFRHREVGDTFLDRILDSGVCRFGKFGAWILIIWSIIMITLLLFYTQKRSDLDHLNKIYIILGIINLVLSLVYTILCFLLNKPLFYRCVPYLMIQFSVSIWLIEIGKTYEKESKK